MPMNPELYPPDWKDISALIKKRAHNRCELCGAVNKEPHPITGSKVILTVHHIMRYHLKDMDEHPCNLVALCQRCHLRLDQPIKLYKRLLYCGGCINTAIATSKAKAFEKIRKDLGL